MTRKDFEFIAGTLAAARKAAPSPTHLSGINIAAEHFADALASTNPRFDRARFLKAAGVH